MLIRKKMYINKWDKLYEKRFMDYRKKIENDKFFEKEKKLK